MWDRRAGRAHFQVGVVGWDSGRPSREGAPRAGPGRWQEVTGRACCQEDGILGSSSSSRLALIGVLTAFAPPRLCKVVAPKAAAELGLLDQGVSTPLILGWEVLTRGLSFMPNLQQAWEGGSIISVTPGSRTHINLSLWPQHLQRIPQTFPE